MSNRQSSGWLEHLVLLVTPALMLGLTGMVLLPSRALAGVPHAVCRTSGDRPETGLSGETTADGEDRSRTPALGFKCNADLVGQYQGEGGSELAATAWQKCAYFDQRHPGNPGSTNEAHPGVVVVNVADPTQPTPSTWLNSPAMIDPWESVKVNPARQLLAGGQRPLNATSPGDGFSVYDISADARSRCVKSAVVLPGSFGHSGQWAPDGKTCYITRFGVAQQPFIAVDVTDPTNPAEIPGGLLRFLLLRPTAACATIASPIQRCMTSNSQRMATPRTSRCSAWVPTTGLRCWTSATSSSAVPIRSTGW